MSSYSEGVKSEKESMSAGGTGLDMQYAVACRFVGVSDKGGFGWIHVDMPGGVPRAAFTSYDVGKASAGTHLRQVIALQHNRDIILTTVKRISGKAHGLRAMPRK